MSLQIYTYNENRLFTNDELKELEKYEILHLGNEFNQPLDNLPNNIKHITFITSINSDDWGCFNHPLENLPINLESLDLMSCDFNQSLDYLPTTLKYFKLYLSCPFYKENLLDNLPVNLEHLCLFSNINKYDISNNSYININENNLFNLNNLPPNLKILEIMPNTYKPIENLPENLETLLLYNNSNNLELDFVPIKLPKNLNLLVINFNNNANYQIIIEKLFNNELTCKNLILYFSHIENYGQYNDTKFKTISYMRTKFPTIKILCNDNYHMFNH
jgi:hypothetical protein